MCLEAHVILLLYWHSHAGFCQSVSSAVRTCVCDLVPGRCGGTTMGPVASAQVRGRICGLTTIMARG
jgi:hypothetical protein